MVEHELMDEVNRLDALSAEAADEFGYYALEEPTTYGVRRTSRRLDLGLTDPDGCHRAKRDRFCAKLATGRLDILPVYGSTDAHLKRLLQTLRLRVE